MHAARIGPLPRFVSRLQAAQKANNRERTVMGKGSGRSNANDQPVFHLRGGHVAPPVSSNFDSVISSSQMGGVSGGLDLSVMHTASASSLEGEFAGEDRQYWPKGLHNIGNTCYANAALQCLLSTALPQALLCPKASAIFRRYSSNPNLLELYAAAAAAAADGSRPALEDHDDEEQEDPVLRTRADDDNCRDDVDELGDTENTDSSNPRAGRRRRRPSQGRSSEERARAREQIQKQREERKMVENCQWLTRELKAITLEYTEPSEPPQSAPTVSSPLQQASSLAAWLGVVPTSRTPVPVIDPGSITSQPDRLSQCLRPYQQEDAHEFLRALLGTLVMNGQNKSLSSLFDGLLESSVTCQNCCRPSLTRDRYMDLSLDIVSPHITNMTEALQEFTKSEVLSGENKVYCQRCETKHTASKGLRLATAPTILVCHFKRFALNARTGGLVRLDKRVDFPLVLEIGDFMSRVNKARPPAYELVAVLVHQGSTCDSGHYLAYVKHNGAWFQCNDSLVRKVNVETVLNQQAYILMYEVAQMREKHGYPSPSKSLSPSKKSKNNRRRKEAALGVDGTTADNRTTISGKYQAPQAMQTPEEEGEECEDPVEEPHQVDNRNDSATRFSLVDIICNLDADFVHACCGGGADWSTTDPTGPMTAAYQYDNRRRRRARSQSHDRRDYDPSISSGDIDIVGPLGKSDSSSLPMRRSKSSNTTHHRKGSAARTMYSRSHRADQKPIAAAASMSAVRRYSSSNKPYGKKSPSSTTQVASLEQEGSSRRKTKEAETPSSHISSSYSGSTTGSGSSRSPAKRSSSQPHSSRSGSKARVRKGDRPPRPSSTDRVRVRHQ